MVLTRYLNDSYLEIFNSPAEATLQPYWHFGLGHEIAHSVWECKVLGYPPFGYGEELVEDAVIKSMPDIALLEPRTIRELGEYFCDAICLKYTFSGSIEEYVAAWVHYYLNWLENESVLEFFSIIAGAPRGGAGAQQNLTSILRDVTALTEGARLKAAVYCQRLFITAAFSIIETDDQTDKRDNDIAWEAALSVRASVAPDNREFIGEPSETFRAKLEEYVAAAERVRDLPMGAQPDQTDRAACFLAELANIARTVREIIKRLPSLPDVDACAGAESNALQKILAGKVCKESVPLPLSLLRRLGPEASFQASIAAGLSLTEWADVEYNHAPVDQGGAKWQKREE